ncbi:MAG: amidohydrolase family protein [Clostridiales bacterium]|nr:amidohydrolase family protein [Clostridiales bacterium]
MIIDFHTHVFPDALASRTVAKLAEGSHAQYRTDGTKEGLRMSMWRAGVDYSVNLPVVTRSGQERTVNRTAVEMNNCAKETGLISFGGIHPDTENYREILRGLAEDGVRGIKIHPVYQGVAIDDIRFLRIIECACENELIVVTHSGYDIGFPGATQVLPQKVRHMIDEIHPDRMVLAHTGGWGCWEEVEEYLVGQDVWFDLSFSLAPVYLYERLEAADQVCKPDTICQADDSGWYWYSEERSGGEHGVRLRPDTPYLSREQFERIVRNHGADRILFGSDSPWSDQGETIRCVRESGLAEEEVSKILGENAMGLLNDKTRLTSFSCRNV